MAGSRLVFRRRLRALLLVLPVLSSLVFLTVSPRPVDAVAGSRLTGSTRAQTAVAVAKHVAGGDLRKLTRIIVVSERSVVDATLATSLAGVLDRCAPTSSCRTAVLLTGPTTLDADTQTAIRDSGLPASALVIVGGSGAISDTVRDSIARAAGWNGSGVNPITRLGGSTRYDTALAITSYVTATKKAQSGDTPSLSFDTLIVVNGDRPADLLLAAGLAHGLGQLIVLTRPNDLPDASRWMFALTQPQRVTIIGGTTNTTPTLETVLRNLLPTSGALTRIGGTDRYETSTLVANLLASNGVTNIAIVSGLDLTDTTTMGLLAQPGAPILYVTPTNIPASVTTWLKANSRLGIIITTIGNTTPDTITQTIDNTITTSTPPTGTPTPPAPDPDPTLPYFAIEVTTTSPSQSATLPLRGDIDVTINWGAAGLTCPTSKTGSGVTTSAGNVTCTYPTAGTYLIRLDPSTGPGPWLTGFGDPIFYPDANVIRRVRGWGNLGLTNLRGAFKSATNLTWVAPPPSAVTDMHGMFWGASSFNRNINGWNTSNVINMSKMFTSAFAFNNGCSPGVYTCALTILTSAVTNMESMFFNATSFNQNISGLDTSRVTTMENMFSDATAFSNGCPAGSTTSACRLNWDTSAVTHMASMFENAIAFNQNINGWDTSNVIDMGYMFRAARAFNNGCSPGTYTCALTITTSAVTNMNSMFTEATSFNQNISTWDTSNVTIMENMFSGAIAFNQNIGNITTSAVADMRSMFAGATAFNNGCPAGSTTSACPLNWDTSAVTNMSGMFDGAIAFNQNISGWDTSAVTNMGYMFRAARAFNNGCSPGTYTCALTITTSAVTNMSSMFQGATDFNQDISSWDTSNVTDMNSMFFEATAFNQNIGNITTSAVTDMSYMFLGATAFNNGCAAGSTTSACPLNWNTVSVSAMSHMFFEATAFNQNISNITTSAVTDMSYMFFGATAFNNGCAAGSTTSACPLNWNTASVSTMSYMFAGATAFNQNISNITTSAVTNMFRMFYNAISFNQNISNWNTSNVGSMQEMFGGAAAFNNGCNSNSYVCALTITTSAVTTMNAMFYNAISFNQNISNWNTSNVGSMQQMFDGAIKFNNGCNSNSYVCALTITTSAVTNMYAMFRDARDFNQDIGSWDTSRVGNMQEMFSRAAVFNQNISTWNTGTVSAMAYMFNGATEFDQNLSGWCVRLIAVEQTGFKTGADAWLLSKPVWGTCPP